MYVSSSETGSFSKRESDQSLIVLANENFGLENFFPICTRTILAAEADVTADPKGDCQCPRSARTIPHHRSHRQRL
jgi:hypothetical protein